MDGRAYVYDTINYTYPDTPAGYAKVALNYTTIGLGDMVNDWLNYTNKIFTADYGLYWFYYNSSYTAVFGEFLENQNSTQKLLTVALDRGAANSFNRE